MNNFTPGINPQFQQTQIAPPSNSGALLGMLQQLVQRKLGPTTLGANGVHVAPGQSYDGYTDAFGNFHFGAPGGGAF